MKYPTVILHAGREQSVARRHQWIFSRAIKRMDKSIADGDIVQVCDHSGNVIATGHYQDSSLAIRILEFGPCIIDAAFWQKKFRKALEYREAIGLTHSREINAFRLIHGEGDTLPGLIVDVYDSIAVLQAHSVGMFLQRHEIAEALMSIPGITIDGVFDKSASFDAEDKDDNLWLAGDGPDQIEIREHGIRFIVDIAQGQKTGFFLDQRVNRQLVKQYSSGKEVLNCFSYTGGFSLYAASGGATSVVSVDASSSALELLERNVQLNNLTNQHTRCEDVLRYLTHATDTFDLIICDPPAFAKSLHKRHNAVQAYKRLNAMAIRRVRPGGMLFTFSCSQVVDRQLFHDTIVAAAIEEGRPVQLMFEMSQGPDHPVSVFHPEGSYLKGLALYFPE